MGRNDLHEVGVGGASGGIRRTALLAGAVWRQAPLAWLIQRYIDRERETESDICIYIYIYINK